jgi:hypothetical protein
MKPLRWTEQDPDDVSPTPREAGALEPPARIPPTAVGLATAPRPPRPPRPTLYGSGLTNLQRAVRFIAAFGLLSGGMTVGLAVPAVTGLLAAAGLVGTGAALGYRAATAPSVYARASLRLRKRGR